jgi:SAM-dependent methyltransferase
VLERLQVVGGLLRMADRCPLCHSTSRERLVWFWLSEGGSEFRFAPGTRIAHFAPEKGLTARLQAAAPAGYLAFDFDPSRYRHLDRVNQADLSHLPLADDSVDLLVCNHVIEHVPDVARALGEIRRVLAPGGTAILQVPIALGLSAPVELGTDSSPAERIERAGQDDHLRLFDRAGYVATLEQAGFSVEQYNPFEGDASAATRWRLDPFEVLFVCR